MDSTVETVISYISVNLPGCPRPLIIDAVKRELASFLRATQVHTVDLDAIDIVEDTYLYALSLPTGYTGYAVYRPTSVWLNGVAQEQGRDFRMASSTSLQLRLIPQSDLTDGLEITVSLSLDDIDTVDITALEDWTYGIQAGAMMALSLMPAKPWTSGEFAAHCRHLRNTAITAALSHAARNGANGALRIGV